MRRAPWWSVGGAQSQRLATETTIIILGLILSVFAVGFFCWLLFTLAVYALPCFVGMTAAFAAYHHSYGVLESGVIGILAGALTLAAGQFLFAWVRMPILRASIALLFAAPAAMAGYHATLGVAHIAMPHDTLSTVLAYIGAALVGATAWARMAVFVSPAAEQSFQGGELCRRSPCRHATRALLHHPP